MVCIGKDERFYSVGQGIFYSCSLQLQREDQVATSYKKIADFVFDCGTSSKKIYLQKNISTYKNRELDLLIISHLDKDHVNGLSMLLKHMTVDNLVLPYLSPIERIQLIAKHNASSWYLEFLQNPTLYFISNPSFKIKNIFYVTKGDTKRIEPRFAGELSFPQEDVEVEKIDIERSMEIDDKAREQAEREDLPEIAMNSKFVNDNKPLQLAGIWEWLFYVSNIKKTDIDLFKKSIRSLHIEINRDILLQMVKNEKLIKKLAGCYRQISKNLNNTSLACLHGPIFKAYRPAIRGKEYVTSEFNPYTFLSGDINFKKEWKVIGFRYKGYLRHIELVQVPHHGSRNSWDPNLLDKINPTFYIICHGLNNRDKHPHSEVFEKILRKASETYSVNEINGFECTYEIYSH